VTIGIYCITEIETGKVYIGQSVDIEKRWRTHQKARPITQFHYRIVHQLLDVDVEALDTLERFYIRMLDCLTPKGLNRTKGGQGMFGHCDTATRAKLSAANKGKTRAVEHGNKLSAALKGKPLTAETRAKLSAANKGKTHSDETREKMSASLKGRLHSLEACEKLSASLKESWRRRRDDKEVSYAVV
jgi:group I intron endonuclease